jgi:hypothetical protein
LRTLEPFKLNIAPSRFFSCVEDDADVDVPAVKRFMMLPGLQHGSSARDLDDDTLALIFSHVSLNDIVLLEAVCKRWNLVSKSYQVC